MKHIASVSFGKDSLAMLLNLIDRNKRIDEVVFYDTEMEFQAIYDTRDKILPLLKENGIKYTELKPKAPFLFRMFDTPVCPRGTPRSCNVCLYCKDITVTMSVCSNPKSKFYKQTDDSGNMPWGKGCDEWDSGEKYGYSWCGGRCRWGTTEKLQALEKYCKGHYEYVGIAADEPERLEKKRNGNKLFPLAEWNMTEAECLKCCYDNGFDWEESGIRLYDILDRVSCWCCGNKNLKELKNIYLYLPEYWERLKKLQARTNRPMKGKDKSVFDLEKRFEIEITEVHNG